MSKNIIENIKALFEPFPRHILIEIPWLEHDDFIDVVNCMDIGLQVSFSETFNIVAADFVDNFIPIITSNEVEWIHNNCKVTDITNADAIVEKMDDLLSEKFCLTIHRNKKLLKKYCEETKEVYLDFLK